MKRGVAKVFRTGHSQAVRIPKEFRFACDELHIEREVERVILTPLSLDPGRSTLPERLCYSLITLRNCPIRYRKKSSRSDDKGNAGHIFLH